MEAKQPTQEQIKELWEWCGFKYQDYIPSFGNLPEQKEAWRYPDGSMCFLSAYGTATGLPELDLNNLFKYAVPKLNNAQRVRLPGIFSDGGKNFVFHWFWDNPALALFWAIWEVIRG